MEIIEVKIGEAARLASMTANEAATLVATLTEQFGREVMTLVDRHRAGSAGRMPPTITQFPVCAGCGTSVQKGTRYCVTCAEKPQYAVPKAMLEVGKQPDPAYQDAPATPVSR